MGFRPSAVVAGKGAARADLRPILVELRAKRADLRQSFLGESSVFPEVFAVFALCARRKASHHQGRPNRATHLVRVRFKKSSRLLGPLTSSRKFGCSKIKPSLGAGPDNSAQANSPSITWPSAIGVGRGRRGK